MENKTTDIYDRVTKFIIKKDAESCGLWEKDMQSLADGLIEFSQTELSLSSPIVPEVVEWEYKHTYSFDMEGGLVNAEELSKLGWELFNVIVALHVPNYYFFFKRQKQKQ